MIDDLLQLHKKLRDKLGKVEYSYAEIGNIFEEMKDDFLIYCNISAKMKAALVWSSSLTTWSSVKRRRRASNFDDQSP